MGDGAYLKVLKSTEQGTAFLLEWNRLRLIIPGGVPADEWLGELNPKDAILLLSGADLIGDGATAAWLDLEPYVVLCTARNNVPDGWVNISQHGWVGITSDGSQLWLEAGR